MLNHRPSATRQDVVVIGASAGGVEALSQLVAALPPGLPAAVLVVVHVPASGPSRLAELLSRAGPLPAARAQDGEAPLPGRIYVASPDQHLVMRDGLLHLSHGPHENHARPAIDPLFRSAARAFGPRVVGVILSGALNDGSRGLAAVKANGGVAIVQDPKEARVGSMPRAALAAAAPVDFILPVRSIAARLAELARQPIADQTRQTKETEGTETMPTDTGTNRDEEKRKQQVVQSDIEAQAQNAPRSGQGAVYACPECGGVLWHLREHQVAHFQCHTGHTYSPQTLLVIQSRSLEATLWAAVRLLAEKKTLTRQLATEFLTEGDEAGRARIEEMERLDEQNECALRQMLEAWPNPTAQACLVEEALEQGRREGQQLPGS